MYLSQNITIDEIQQIFQSRELRDSDIKILLYLEKYGFEAMPITEEKKKELPNSLKIIQDTALASNTVTDSLKRLNNRNFIVYTRLKREKKAFLTRNGFAIIEYLKNNNKTYYDQIKNDIFKNNSKI